MKIGIIGPKDSIGRILLLKDEFNKEITFNLYQAHSLKDTKEMIHKCYLENDGILFTGPSVYDSILDCIHLEKPHVYIPYDETSLYSLLLENSNANFKNLSIDVLNKNHVDEVLTKTSIKEYDVLDFDHGLNENDYINFHLKNLENKDTTILTTFSPIYDYFKERNMDVYRLYNTPLAIRYSLNSLILDIKNSQLDSSKIAIQLIKISFKNNTFDKFKELEENLTFQSNLVGYLKKIQGAIFNRGSLESIIFSNKKNMTNLDNHKEFIKIISKYNFNIFSGIGIGETYLEAEMNAETALDFSISKNESSLYFCDEKKDIQDLSKIENKNIIIKDMDYDNISEISLKTNLSTNFIKRIMTIMELYNTDEFTSKSLATYLGVSEKSSRRILKKLLDSNIAIFLGKESSPLAGRPQNIVKINFKTC